MTRASFVPAARICEDPPLEMEIELNGATREVEDGATVARLVESLGLRPEIVAVEVNRALVRKDRRGEVRLAPGDRVEVVTLVGGG